MAQDLTLIDDLARQLGYSLDDARKINEAFGAGIVESYPVLSIASTQWTLRLPGQDKDDWKVQMNADGEPSRSIPLILLKANPGISKKWWPTGFDERNPTAPHCYSSDGKVPDEDVPDRQHPVCASCPMNEFKSAAKGGKMGEGKACGDTKVVAVLTPTLMEKPWRAVLLRVPATSLKNIKAYTDALSRKGVPAHRILTKATLVARAGGKGSMIEFEPSPKAPPIPEAKWKTDIEPILNDPATESMLRRAINAGNVEPLDDTDVEAVDKSKLSVRAAAAVQPKPALKPAPEPEPESDGFEGLDLDLTVPAKEPAKAPAEAEEASPFDADMERALDQEAAQASPVAALKEKKAAKKPATPAPVKAKPNGEEAKPSGVVVSDTPDEMADVITALFPGGLPT